MTYHDPEHLSRAKLAVKDSADAIHFNHNVDYPSDAVADLMGQMGTLLRAAKDLSEAIADEIDAHGLGTTAKKDVREHLIGGIEGIRADIAFDHQRFQPDHAANAADRAYDQLQAAE